MVYETKPSRRSDNYFAVVTGYIYKKENGENEIHLLTEFDTDVYGTGVFTDIEDYLLQEIQLGEKNSHFFKAFVTSWFEMTYGDLDGWETDVGCTVVELSGMIDFMEALQVLQKSLLVNDEATKEMVATVDDGMEDLDEIREQARRYRELESLYYDDSMKSVKFNEKIHELFAIDGNG